MLRIYTYATYLYWNINPQGDSVKERCLGEVIKSEGLMNRIDALIKETKRDLLFLPCEITALYEETRVPHQAPNKSTCALTLDLSVCTTVRH